MKRAGDRAALDGYLRSLRRYPLLGREEEHAIAVQLARTAAPALGARLITANLRLVVKIALEYRHTRANVLHLVQEGNLGLMRAVRKYDPYRGVKLASYAAWWIRAYILKFLEQNWHLVRFTGSRANKKLFFALGKEREKLEKQGLPADAKPLAIALGVVERDVVEMEQQMTVPCSSLDALIRSDDGGGRARGDVLSADPDLRPDVLVETDELGRAVKNLGTFAATLPSHKQEILRDRLFTDEPAPKVEIAVRFGVTRERIGQIEEGLEKQLRRRLSADLGAAVNGRSISRGRVAGHPRATRRREGGQNPTRQARGLLEETPG